MLLAAHFAGCIPWKGDGEVWAVRDTEEAGEFDPLPCTVTCQANGGALYATTGAKIDLSMPQPKLFKTTTQFGQSGRGNRAVVSVSGGRCEA